MRRGIYGGTFDPVHFGHLLLAEQCCEQLGLDQVHFVPAGDPPHKDKLGLTDGKMRAEMLDFATAGAPHLVVDRRELKRNGPSYTVETLREFQTSYPDDDLFFLMGADSLAYLAAWREPQEILKLATVAAVGRPGGIPLDRDKVKQVWGDELADKIQVIEMPQVDLSATDIRRRVRTGKSIRFMVPASVEAYIADKKLYEGEFHERPLFE
ncbi:nicotinate-nucleotide adenylyltransferase [Calycomorphotria hydatis]|uniref:Probable nicotinate-nucleotide adenylyltransferase n=1 Tax=Calycomorphotria hydatis TaxID=2528027 RepID=A0A517T599_9PLAN|nr:nicotinate-nucleotide adenylyltransferase [Calycomorphotria hydatis]QDT63547.1 Nicotinate-nucleotide adenylyltransferase [Calycomorphotria hydatis]